MSLIVLHTHIYHKKIFLFQFQYIIVYFSLNLHLKLSQATYPQNEGNVHNHLAKSFLEQHGASLIEPSFELQHRNDVSLMSCQHCIKRIIGLCSKNGHIANSDLKPYINDGNFTEPFYLSTASGVKLKLEFDCKNCEMKVYRS